MNGRQEAWPPSREGQRGGKVNSVIKSSLCRACRQLRCGYLPCHSPIKLRSPFLLNERGSVPAGVGGLSLPRVLGSRAASLTTSHTAQGPKNKGILPVSGWQALFAGNPLFTCNLRWKPLCNNRVRAICMEAKDVESRASDPTLSARPEGAPKARKLENVSLLGSRNWGDLPVSLSPWLSQNCSILCLGI